MPAEKFSITSIHSSKSNFIDPENLTDTQIAILECYDQGEATPLIGLAKTDKAEFMRRLNSDILLTFLMRHTSPSDGCNSDNEAIRRLGAVMHNCQEVIDNLSMTIRNPSL